MAIIPALNLQSTVGSAERFLPTGISGQILPSSTLPYLITPPLPVGVENLNQTTLDQRLTLGSSSDYCDFDLTTFACRQTPLSQPTVLTTNRGEEINRQQLINEQDRQDRGLKNQLSGMNLYFLIGIPFLLFFIGKRYL
jgi:hypothetical protein